VFGRNGQVFALWKFAKIFLTDDRNEIATHKFSLDVEQADGHANWLCRLLDVPRRRNLHSDRTGEIERQTLVSQAAVDAPEEVIAPCRIFTAARQFPTGKIERHPTLTVDPCFGPAAHGNMRPGGSGMRMDLEVAEMV
jgi:hypothetical protein